LNAYVSIQINLPESLREYCGLPMSLQVKATSVVGLLRDLRENQPKLFESVCDETGRLRRHINLFVNSDLSKVRSVDEVVDETTLPLRSGDQVTIWPAVSGG
jgi:sulfur-carrier protein